MERHKSVLVIGIMMIAAALAGCQDTYTILRTQPEEVIVDCGSSTPCVIDKEYLGGTVKPGDKVQWNPSTRKYDTVGQ